MSQTFDLAGIVKAIAGATDFIQGELASWKPALGAGPAITEAQRELLHRLEAISFDLAQIPELKAWASLSADEINRILAENGFNIRVRPWPNDGRAFGVVAILDVTVEWVEEGEKTTIYVHNNKKDYPAFKLETEGNPIQCLEAPDSNEPLIRIQTKSGDVVCIHQMPDVHFEGFDLYDTARRITRESAPDYAKYGEVEDVTIPMVRLRQEVDISWMRGMHLPGTNPESGLPDHFSVDEAKQEVRFVMNEHGARAKTATVLGMRSLGVSIDGPIKHVVVKDDFLIWVERPGIETPVFVAYITKDDWSDPGSLENV